MVLSLSLLALAVSAFAKKYNIVSGTNCISVDGKRFPLNQLVLRIAPDSIKVQFFTVAGYGDTYDYAPVTPLDSFSNYQNAGTNFTSVSQIDSFYQAKFVK